DAVLQEVGQLRLRGEEGRAEAQLRADVRQFLPSGRGDRRVVEDEERSVSPLDRVLSSDLLVSSDPAFPPDPALSSDSVVSSDPLLLADSVLDSALPLKPASWPDLAMSPEAVLPVDPVLDSALPYDSDLPSDPALPSGSVGDVAVHSGCGLGAALPCASTQPLNRAASLWVIDLGHLMDLLGNGCPGPGSYRPGCWTMSYPCDSRTSLSSVGGRVV
ncbi:hypothetical protein IRJ41_021021, partial [Triplophysa rosa]